MAELFLVSGRHGEHNSNAILIHGLGGHPHKTWETQVIFSGGDGWLYSFDPAGDGDGNSSLLWKFDCNPKTSLYLVRGRYERSHIIKGAMISDGLVTAYGAFFYSNRAFLPNCLDFLSGSSDLVNIRSRGSARRELETIVEIQKAAASKTMDKVTAINAEIQAWQTELNQLNTEATKKNVGIKRSQAQQTERDTRLKIMRKKRELRDVKRESREAVDAVKGNARMFNTLGLPLLVSLIGLVLWIMRTIKRTRMMREDMA